ncbi:MAG: hypothetical protein NTY18_04925, partial [Deltaproteobacteria bacterium]|nr:hypothetical protein [Deltaproteobacteria bacterium]
MKLGARKVAAWSIAAASLLVTAACGGSAVQPQAGPGVLDGSAFVAVPKEISFAAASQLRAGQMRTLASSQLSAGESFFLAIKKTELTKRYFLSAYLEQV